MESCLLSLSEHWPVPCRFQIVNWGGYFLRVPELIPGWLFTRASAAARYAFAVACCVAAFLIRVWLDPVLHASSPLILFAVAVAVSALRGGFGPGLLTVILSCFAALYFFPERAWFAIAPGYQSSAASQILVFLIAAIILSLICTELRRLRWEAVRLAKERNDILESIPDGFVALNHDWQVIYVNKEAEQLTEVPRDQLGKRLWQSMPHLGGTAVEEKLRRVMEERVAIRFEQLLPGWNRWFEFHAQPEDDRGISIYFTDVTARKMAELRLRETLAERDAALEKVRQLTGLLPICAGCKKIRDNKGAWQPLETYISNHSEAKFSHGLCLECAKKYFGHFPEELP
jgi:PAS domain S-box-containing protein